MTDTPPTDKAAKASGKAAARTLKFYVHVENPATGQIEEFAAGSTPPDWAQSAITNPNAWLAEGETLAPEELPAPGPGQSIAYGPDAVQAGGAGVDRGAQAAQVAEPPF